MSDEPVEAAAAPPPPRGALRPLFAAAALIAVAGGGSPVYAPISTATARDWLHDRTDAAPADKSAPKVKHGKKRKRPRKGRRW